MKYFNFRYYYFLQNTIKSIFTDIQHRILSILKENVNHTFSNNINI